MSDEETAKDLLKFWSNYEAATRTAKTASAVAMKLGDTADLSNRALPTAWDMISPHVAEDYTLVNPSGHLRGKDRTEEVVKTGTGVFPDSERTDHLVKIYGDMAVYHSLVTLKGQRGGQDITGQYRETHVLLKKEHGWLLVASQMTKVDPTDTLPK